MTDQFRFLCSTIEDTQALAAAMGRAMRGGEVIELVSDLGGGKTTFVKGLGRGMGVTGVIQSPTFTLSQLHKAARDLELHHFDFYRLHEAGVMAAELAESLSQPNAVTAVEWGDIVQGVLPPQKITISLTVGEGEDRIIRIRCHPKVEHIARALTDYKTTGSLA